MNSALASRRGFLQNAAALAVATPAVALARAEAPKGPVYGYLGGYSSPQGIEGNKANGKGIYVFELDHATGGLKQIGFTADEANPSSLALNPAQTHLYVANEVNNFGGKRSGSVSAFAINRATGQLTPLNAVSSEGSGPAHLSVHPGGKHVLVANYGGGSVTVLPIQPDGSLGAATDSKKPEGTVGAKNATSAPPGSFAISGHERSHAHMIQASPSGKYVLSTDLAFDRIFIWKFDAAAGTLTPNTVPSAALPSGDGPRHLAFHPKGKWLYSVQEEGSTVVTFDYDDEAGTLKEKQTLSSLPKGFAGTNFTSEILVSSDGRFVYAQNRLHDSTAIFSIGRDGTLTFIDAEWTRGDYPRSSTIDPSGNYFYSLNQKGDAVTIFRINRKTGALKFTGQYLPMGSPSSLVFVS